MEREDFKHLLMSASHEIQSLRRRNEVLQAKVDGFELAGALLHARPNERNEGMAIDVVWELQREIDAINTGPAQGPT